MGSSLERKPCTSELVQGLCLGLDFTFSSLPWIYSKHVIQNSKGWEVCSLCNLPKVSKTVVSEAHNQGSSVISGCLGTSKLLILKLLKQKVTGEKKIPQTLKNVLPLKLIPRGNCGLSRLCHGCLEGFRVVFAWRMSLTHPEGFLLPPMTSALWVLQHSGETKVFQA